MEEKYRDQNGLTEEEFLASYDPKNYPHPYLTADILVFHGKELLLIKRGNHPCIYTWAIPGGFVEEGESADTAAARELQEETGVEGLELTQLGLYSEPGRDPRAWVVSEAYTAFCPDEITVQAGDDAKEAKWFHLENLGDEIRLTSEDIILAIRVENGKFAGSKGLAFDHGKMILDAVKKFDL